jgi:hypothetical protein
MSATGRERQSTNGPALQTLASDHHFSMAGFGHVRSMRTNGQLRMKESAKLKAEMIGHERMKRFRV